MAYYSFFVPGGLVGFQSLYPEYCENKIWKYPGLTALSQPCLPATSSGPTRILPFLYLGSEEDSHNKELLQVFTSVVADNYLPLIRVTYRF